MRKLILIALLLLAGCINGDRLSVKSNGTQRAAVRDRLRRALEVNDAALVKQIVDQSLASVIHKDTVRIPAFAPLLYKAVPFDKKNLNSHDAGYMEELVHRDDLPFIETLVCSSTSVEQSLGAILLLTIIKEDLGGSTAKACECVNQLAMEQTALGMSVMKTRAACGDHEALRVAYEKIKATGKEYRVSSFSDVHEYYFPSCPGEKECAAQALEYAPQLDAHMMPLLIAKAGIGAESGIVKVLGRHRVPAAKARLIEIAGDVGNEYGVQQTAAVEALSRYDDPQLQSLFLKLYREFQQLKHKPFPQKNYQLQIALLKALAKVKDSTVLQILEEATQDTLNTCSPSLPMPDCYPVARAAKRIIAKREGS